MKPVIASLVAVALLGAVACTKPRSAHPCPESRNVRCLGAPKCSWDEQRDCEVCVCDESDNRRQQQKPPGEPMIESAD